MTVQERLDWIDKANYEELLYKWRFEPIGSAWFTNNTITDYYIARMRILRKADPNAAIAASKSIGLD